MKTLQSMRDSMIAQMVSRQVKAYLKGVKLRTCASCGIEFEPRQRWHFFCGGICRRRFYRGVFRPRSGD
jgi:hypothetical protein